MMENKRSNGNNNYRRESGNYNNNGRGITCYICGKEGHYSTYCRERTETRECNKCEKVGHLARACRSGVEQSRNNTGNNTGNRERRLNYIGTQSSEGSEYYDSETSSDKEDERRLYPVSTRSQKYRNAGTNNRRERTNNFQQRKMDKLVENDRRRLNSESRKELEQLDEESEDEIMTDTEEKKKKAIEKALEAKRRKNKCKRCGGIGHFVPDCPTLTENKRKYHEELRQKNKEKRKEKSKRHVEFEEGFNILNSPCGLTVEQAMKYIPTYK